VGIDELTKETGLDRNTRKGWIVGNRLKHASMEKGGVKSIMMMMMMMSHSLIYWLLILPNLTAWTPGSGCLSLKSNLRSCATSCMNEHT